MLATLETCVAFRSVYTELYCSLTIVNSWQTLTRQSNSSTVNKRFVECALAFVSNLSNAHAVKYNIKTQNTLEAGSVIQVNSNH